MLIDRFNQLYMFLTLDVAHLNLSHPMRTGICRNQKTPLPPPPPRPKKLLEADQLDKLYRKKTQNFGRFWVLRHLIRCHIF